MWRSTVEIMLWSQTSSIVKHQTTNFLTLSFITTIIFNFINSMLRLINSHLLVNRIQSHLFTDVIPTNIIYSWNIGFLFCCFVVVQVITGILVAFNYISDIKYACASVFYINCDIFHGWFIHYIHGSNVSVLFVLLYLHIIRALFCVCYVFNYIIWLICITIFIMFIVIGFTGYVLTWGQISFCGVAVIINILAFSLCNVVLKNMIF